MLKKSSKYIVIIGLITLSLIITASNDEYKFKVNKSFEIYGHLFKELSKNYVLEINPETLMEESIDGMLNSLDPYTTYYNDSETGDLDVITDGNYVGFGITVGERNNNLTVIDVRHNFGAHKAGLMIGDILIEIDSVNIAGRKSKAIKKYTKGKPNSKAMVKVIRPGVDDTLLLVIKRERVIINNIDYSDYLQEGIAYIKLSRFSRNTANDLRSDLLELKRNGNLNSLVLDLRSNPGGLLDVSIDVCELFFEKGTMIVSTKGRTSAFNREYKTSRDPLFLNLPVAVLIDEHSASASEIVAGAFQDYDRGIVLGKKSFGKGLVQSVYNLPYRSKIKLTTARYYTPSGRCIQKFDIAKKIMADSKKKESDSVFHTKNNRIVFENNGISPDSVVDNRNYSSLVSELLKEYLIFDFVSEYVGKNELKLDQIAINDKLFSDFKSYLIEREYFSNSLLIKQLNSLEKTINDQIDTNLIDEHVTEIKSKISQHYKVNFDKHKTEINESLEFELKRRFLSHSNLIGEFINMDNTVISAIQLLSPMNYGRILANEKNINNTRN